MSRDLLALERPRVNAPLVLAVDGVDGEVRSRLEDLWGPDLVVAAVSVPGRVGLQRPGSTITVRWAVPPRGVLELPCTVVDHLAEQPPRWVLRADGPVRRVQRRRFVRADVLARAELEPLREEGTPGEHAPDWHAVGLVADLCEGGARVLVERGRHVVAALGDVLLLVIRLPDRAVRTTCQVVGVEPAAGQRLQLRLLFDLPDRDAEVVRREVLRRQTEARSTREAS